MPTRKSKKPSANPLVKNDRFFRATFSIYKFSIFPVVILLLTVLTFLLFGQTVGHFLRAERLSQLNDSRQQVVQSVTNAVGEYANLSQVLAGHISSISQESQDSEATETLMEHVFLQYPALVAFSVSATSTPVGSAYFVHDPGFSPDHVSVERDVFLENVRAAVPNVPQLLIVDVLDQPHLLIFLRTAHVETGEEQILEMLIDPRRLFANLHSSQPLRIDGVSTDQSSLFIDTRAASNVSGASIDKVRVPILSSEWQLSFYDQIGAPYGLWLTNLIPVFGLVLGLFIALVVLLIHWRLGQIKGKKPSSFTLPPTTSASLSHMLQAYGSDAVFVLHASTRKLVYANTAMHTLFPALKTKKQARAYKQIDTYLGKKDLLTISTILKEFETKNGIHEHHISLRVGRKRQSFILHTQRIPSDTLVIFFLSPLP